jgi:hypothetical protein
MIEADGDVPGREKSKEACAKHNGCPVESSTLEWRMSLLKTEYQG